MRWSTIFILKNDPMDEEEQGEALQSLKQTFGPRSARRPHPRDGLFASPASCALRFPAPARGPGRLRCRLARHALNED